MSQLPWESLVKWSSSLTKISCREERQSNPPFERFCLPKPLYLILNDFNLLAGFSELKDTQLDVPQEIPCLSGRF